VPPIDRLRALDAAFLDLESEQAPLHVGWTIRVDGPAPSLAALRRHVESRLVHLPRFRRRVVRPRLGIGDPHWVDDAGFDVAHHVDAMTLAQGAGPAQLREVAGALLSRPLDPCRPLWRLYLVRGPGDDWAVIGQAHHALVDGIAAVEVAMLLFDAAGHPPLRSPAPDWAPARAPTAPDAALAFLRDRAIGALGIARAAAAAAGRRPQLSSAIAQLAAPAPSTSLDRAATRRRVVAFGAVPMEGARDAGRRHGATINDVLLAAAGLALGRALRRRGERPATIKVMVPVNLRDGDDAGALGNRISFVFVALPVGETDPIGVLRAVAGQMRARKATGAAAPLQALAGVADLLPAAPRGAVARAAARAASFNVVVSNVPGPPVELALLGRRVSAIHPAVPLIHGHALSIGALSYRGRLHLGLYADALVLPDVVEVGRDLEAGFDALRLAARPDTPWRARARARRQRGAASRYTGPASDVT
jgi:diacylglycerol O-acyltransferase / wax synthase